ncbi:MAG: hypothetical protein LHW46_00465, partial [Candidatus Cloacimonetes bacterium]|nr:hypothetical protein [Candidatus Cloacimonadota bacterium]
EEVKQIDVYVGDTKIDTVACQTLSAQNGRVFDVDVRGILYDVSDAYQEQIERIVFKDAASGDILPEAFVSVFRRDDAKYNELSFMKSLEEPIQERIKTTPYREKNVGFLATDENLDDVVFMEYLGELLQKIKGLELRIFAFNLSALQRAKSCFSEFEAHVRCFEISRIDMLVQNVNVFAITHKTALNYKVFAFLREKTSVVAVHFNETAKEMSVGSVKALHLENRHPLVVDPSYFGFTNGSLEKSGFSIHKMLYERFLGFIDESENLHDFAYIRWVEGVLQKREMRDFAVAYLQAEFRYSTARI